MITSRGTSTPFSLDEKEESEYIYSGSHTEISMDDQVRFQLIAPCGVGKTNMSAHLALMMKAKVIVFVCPLILLVKQTVWEYTNILADFTQDGKGLCFEIKSHCSMREARLFEGAENTDELNNVGVEHDAMAAVKWLLKPETRGGGGGD